MAAVRKLAPGETLPPLEPADVDLEASEPLAVPSGSQSPPRRSNKHTKRFETINGFVDSRMRGLPRAAVVVWFVLWRDERAGTSRTARADLARRTGCNERTITRAIRRLVKDGLLEVVRQGGLGKGPSRYRVLAG